MFYSERQDKILELLNAKGSVTVSELEGLFGISTETVRRDLLALESQKKLMRVHGGALSIKSKITAKKFERRQEENRSEKRELSEYAARFVSEGDSIAIDAGSTAVFFCEILVERFHSLTVVVNSLMLFQILSKNKGFHVILCGGDYQSDESYFCGLLTIKAIEALHVSKFFMAPGGISLKYGLTEFGPHCVDVQRAYAKIADKVFVIADSSKIEVGCIYHVMPISTDITIITDHQLDDTIYLKYLESDIDIVREDN